MFRQLLLLSTLLSTQVVAMPVNAPRIYSVAPAISMVINDGDSMCFTHGSNSGVTFLSATIPIVGKNFFSNNLCSGGATIVGMNTSFSTRFPPLYSASYPVFLVVVLAGGNDFRLGADEPTTYSRLQTYIALVHALGANAKVALASYPLQCDIFQSGTWLPLLHAYNNDIYAKWNVPQASGGLGADYLLDYFAEPTVGANTYASSPYCSTTYSPDGQHLNDAGKATMALVQAKLLRQVIP